MNTLHIEKYEFVTTGMLLIIVEFNQNSSATTT